MFNETRIKTVVANKYSDVAVHPRAKFEFPVGRRFAESVGYPPELLDKLPASFWESFTGAGNPQPFIDIAPGETVLDLGCGAGLDVYLYAQAAGPRGKVYGIDISSGMIAKAQRNMATLDVHNTEFICAAADRIPLPDHSIDLVTANGIYNLAPDKTAVMREAARLLKAGGRTIFAEIILKEELEREIRADIHEWFRCIGGALQEAAFLNQLLLCGLSHPEVLWKGRNARTGHKSAWCAVIRAEKLPELSQ